MARKLDRFAVLGELKSGKFVPSNALYEVGMLRQFDDCPKVRRVYERVKANLSKEQMGYLWGVVYPEIAIHTGHTPEELHSVFKSKFLREKMVWRETELTTLRSTSAMTTNELAEFISQVILEAGELGITVPEADKSYQFK